MDSAVNAICTLYSKYNCVNCDQTKALLKKLNIPYSEINIEDHLDALEFLRLQGYQAAPVVITEEDAWSGFQPDRIRSLQSSSVVTNDEDWSF